VLLDLEHPTEIISLSTAIFFGHILTAEIAQIKLYAEMYLQVAVQASEVPVALRDLATLVANYSVRQPLLRGLQIN
jgi:hypothetical protein